MGPKSRVASGVLFSLLTAALGATGRGDEPQPDAPDAAQVLERMGKAYAGCKTYRDSGVVKTDFIRPAGNFTSEKPFTTAFIRPDQFRYEFKDKLPDGRVTRFIIWKHGKDVASWWDIQPGVRKHESLDLPVAVGTGISGSSAHTVPTMLLHDEVSGGRLTTELTDAKRIEDARVGEMDCYRVEGKFGNQPHILWVEKKTYLLRRIDQKMTFSDFRTEQTTTYDPVVDGEIDAPRLKFDHPEPK